MKIWRKDSTRPIKEDKKAKKPELTDISKVSTPTKKNTDSSKMEEIYSTKDKQIKYKRLTPLEAEEAAKRQKAAKEKLTSGEVELAPVKDNEAEQIVELTYEAEEGTVIADDIIEDFEPIRKKQKLKVNEVTEIDIDPNAIVKKHENQANFGTQHKQQQKENNVSAYEQIFGKPKLTQNSEKVIAKVPTYQHDSKINLINLKAGKFTDIVESEYNEYLKSNESVIAKKRAGTHNSKTKKACTAIKDINPFENTKRKKPFKNVKKFFKISFALIAPKKNTFEKSDTKAKNGTAKSPDLNIKEDSKYVAKELTSNLKKLVLKFSLLLSLFAVSLTLTIMELNSSIGIMGTTPYSSLIYCLCQLVVLLLVGLIGKDSIVNGLMPLKHFRGNSETALSCAYIACLLQQIVSMFMSGAFFGSHMYLYTAIVSLGFVLNSLGRIIMIIRVRENFKFITAKSPANSAKILKDDELAHKMLSGTIASSCTVAYQHKTESLSDFLKISYAPDPSEELSGKLAPITLVSSVFVAIVYGIMMKTFVGAFSALAVMSCISIPFSALLTGNIPLLLMCKNSLKHNAMISSYPSVRQFSDCDAVTVNAKELYPKTSVALKHIEYFAQYRVEEAMLCAAIVMKEAGSPLYRVFKNILKKNSSSLKKVESIVYEDKLGLIGWIDGERVLIGNKKLLDRYHIYIEDASIEKQYKHSSNDITYIACSGQLIAMVVSKYTPDENVKRELHRAQKHGICLAVTTTDCNITSEKIATDYEVYARSVKVLNTGYANAVHEECIKKAESSKAFFATRGSFVSFIHALSNIITFRHNLTIGLIIEIFGLILGVLLCATMVLYASVSILGIIEMLLYMLFWSAATIIAQFVKLP